MHRRIIASHEDYCALDSLSRRSSFSFISVPQRYPPRPPLATTRWQGTRMAKGFAAMARPTARAAPGWPRALLPGHRSWSCRAVSPAPGHKSAFENRCTLTCPAPPWGRAQPQGEAGYVCMYRFSKSDLCPGAGDPARRDQELWPGSRTRRPFLKGRRGHRAGPWPGNPFAPLVPCHRVVAKGSLGWSLRGTEMKEKLLPVWRGNRVHQEPLVRR